jgi:hypothetical protein
MNIGAGAGAGAGTRAGAISRFAILGPLFDKGSITTSLLIPSFWELRGIPSRLRHVQSRIMQCATSKHQYNVLFCEAFQFCINKFRERSWHPCIKEFCGDLHLL